MIDQLFSRVPIESLVGYTAEFLLEMVHHSAARTWAARACSPVATLPMPHLDAGMSPHPNAPGAHAQGENLFFVILFTVYLLLDTRKGKRDAKPETPSRTDMLILEYIKGKARLLPTHPYPCPYI